MAAEYLRKAIPLMVGRKIPANPINYTLWYNYVAEHIPLLKSALDKILAGDEGLTPEKSEELFIHYIVNEHIDGQNQTLKDITLVANNILAFLGQSINGSENFERELGENIEQLEQASSLNEVTSIINQVINSTESIRSANSQFQQEMKVANDEITILKQKLQETEAHAYIDKLTQLYNRSAFDRELSALLNEDKADKCVHLILVDLDHFKSFNDDYGHVIGDRVLHRLGELLQDNCPDNVIAARYGGEEFALIVDDSSLEETKAVAENLRQKIQQIRVKLKNSDNVLDNISASFGIARYQTGETTENFIDRADQALYRAKDLGRNRVEVFSEKNQPA
jgi:diguanylate cyclase